MRVIPRGAVNDMAQLAGGTYGKGGDVLDGYLWDTEGFANTNVRAETRFFQKGYGGNYGYAAGANKTLTETNLTDTGKLAAGQSFLVKAISLAFHTNLEVEQATKANAIAAKVLSSWYTLLRGSVFEFSFANQDFAWQAPGHIFLPSVSVAAGQNTTITQATDSTYGVKVGEFQHMNWISIKTPLVIGELVSFKVVMKSGTGDSTAMQLGDATSALYSALSLMTVIMKGTFTRSK
jgi:hypothetical protein